MRVIFTSIVISEGVEKAYGSDQIVPFHDRFSDFCDQHVFLSELFVLYNIGHNKRRSATNTFRKSKE